MGTYRFFQYLCNMRDDPLSTTVKRSVLRRQSMILNIPATNRMRWVTAPVESFKYILPHASQGSLHEAKKHAT
jgi:hypothetical protein